MTVMDDATVSINRHVTRIILLIQVFLFVMWALTSAKPFLAGLILGGMVSLYFFQTLARRIRLMREMTLSGNGRRVGTGIGFRILMVAVCLIGIARVPEHVNVVGFLLGLPMSGAVLAFVLLRDERHR